MHLKNFNPRLYAFDLDSGDEVRPDPAHGLVCFLIAERSRDPAFIRERATLLLRAGCRRFRFFGKQMIPWYFCVDELDAEAGPGINPQLRAQLRAYATEKGISEDIKTELKSGTDDIFILYDHRQAALDLLFAAFIGEEAWPDAEDLSVRKR